MFRHIFNGLEERYARELQVIREQYPSEPVQFTEEPLIIHCKSKYHLLYDLIYIIRDGCNVFITRKWSRSKYTISLLMFSNFPNSLGGY